MNEKKNRLKRKSNYNLSSAWQQPRKHLFQHHHHSAVLQSFAHLQHKAVLDLKTNKIAEIIFHYMHHSSGL